MSATMQLACPACDAINRVPVGRLDASPRCGRCKQPLFEARPLALDGRRFDVHAGRSELPLLVDFWAPWCGPCIGMAPQFELAARQLEPAMRLAKVDTEAEPALGQRFAIRSIPTLALLVQGREVARQAGAMAANDIVRWARQALQSSTR
jgi:thioredoxin 2